MYLHAPHKKGEKHWIYELIVTDDSRDDTGPLFKAYAVSHYGEFWPRDEYGYPVDGFVKYGKTPGEALDKLWNVLIKGHPEEEF